MARIDRPISAIRFRRQRTGLFCECVLWSGGGEKDDGNDDVQKSNSPATSGAWLLGGGGEGEKLFKHERTFYETRRTEAHERSEADYTYTQTFSYKYVITVIIIIIDV